MHGRLLEPLPLIVTSWSDKQFVLAWVPAGSDLRTATRSAQCYSDRMLLYNRRRQCPVSSLPHRPDDNLSHYRRHGNRDDLVDRTRLDFGNL